MKDISLMVLALFLILITISGCISEVKSPEETKYTDITVKQGKEMIDQGEVFILDVRTLEEYAAGHINGSMLLAVQDIPEQELNDRLMDIPKDRKILVYCRSGTRSLKASKILVDNGFSEVYNMQGGITDWIKAGYEVIK